VKAVLILPETERPSFLDNLVDRPFLRHTLEFLAAHGVRDVAVLGPAPGEVQSRLGVGREWDMSIEYRAAHKASACELPGMADTEALLLASAACLPMFPLKQHLEGARGAIVYGPRGGRWTGWALLKPGDVRGMPPLWDRERVLSYLKNLRYASLSADLEFRCGTEDDLWRAHKSALDSNLSSLFHHGREVRPGVWVGRNASLASSAKITAPAYIGENSRIGRETQIGPFAAIAKNCLIAPRTIIRHSVIAPGSYVGSDLELDHVMADKRRLFDVRLGVTVPRVGYPILDDVFDFHWPAITLRTLTKLQQWFRRGRQIETRST
jgi:hypothetical protein